MARVRGDEHASEDDEIVQAFLEESRENLDHLDRDLVDLEAQPGDPELLANVFRTVHTIKGTCGFLGFSRLEALAHVGENLLGALRDGDLAMDAAITTSLLGLIDAVRSVMDRIQASGAEGDDEHAEVIADLDRHLMTKEPDQIAHRAIGSGPLPVEPTNAPHRFLLHRSPHRHLPRQWRCHQDPLRLPSQRASRPCESTSWFSTDC